MNDVAHGGRLYDQYALHRQMEALTGHRMDQNHDCTQAMLYNAMSATHIDTLLLIPANATRCPISAVLITLNAQAQLDMVLRSVSFCDDIVIVDSGSTDQTLDIAQQHGARVIQKEWIGFGPQKAFAVANARYDWVLCIDADEEVSPGLRAQIEDCMARQARVDVTPPTAPPPPAAYCMPRSNYFINRFLRHGEGYPDMSLRLFNRQQARWSDDVVHEKVLVAGPVGTLQGDLLHHSAESIHDYLNKQNRYTTLQAQTLFERGKRPGMAQLVLSPVLRFVKFYVIKRGFLDGWPGFVHISIGCINSFMKYAKARALFDATPPGLNQTSNPARHIE